ncbi:MAG: LLM class flavin-dependent oxidoreductase [Solibacillus sp.]
MTNSIEQVELGWFIPVRGDGEFVGVEPNRPATTDYLVKVAKAAEEAGFTFALIPTGRGCLDSWVVGSIIISHTKKLAPLMALRPGLVSPVVAARMGATLDVLSNGRARFNIVTGGAVPDLKSMGDPLFDNHSKRYDRTTEFLKILRELWENSTGPGSSEFLKNGDEDTGEGEKKVTFKGEYYDLEEAISHPEVLQKPLPPIYFGGSSEKGKRVAAETADVFLMWAEPVGWIREQIEEVEGYLHEQKESKGIDRQLSYGLRAHVLVRETEEEALAAAYKVISKVDPEVIEKAAEKYTNAEFLSVGEARQNQLRAEAIKNNYFVSPNLWSGLALVRNGGSLTFVGTPEQVADRLLEYVDAGISKFILSGYPHLEEATITGQLLLPVLKEKLASRDILVTV